MLSPELYDIRMLHVLDCMIDDQYKYHTGPCYGQISSISSRLTSVSEMREKEINK
jgi:hypothetical protein